MLTFEAKEQQVIEIFHEAFALNPQRTSDPWGATMTSRLKLGWCKM